MPRVRDFRGVTSNAFDGRGNYTLGVEEQVIFPEGDYDKVERIKGQAITVVTSAKPDAEGRSYSGCSGRLSEAKLETEKEYGKKIAHQQGKQDTKFAMASGALSGGGRVRGYGLEICHVPYCFGYVALRGEIRQGAKSQAGQL